MNPAQAEKEIRQRIVVTPQKVVIARRRGRVKATRPHATR